MTDLRVEQALIEEALIVQIRQRAHNLYQTRQMLCTEAVLVALNHGLGGDLTEAQAVAMAAPFCAALGESGCLCGALSGAVLASGLLLGSGNPYARRREMRDNALELHNAFKTAHGATCCRVLTRAVRHDSSAHFRQCAGFTAQAAEMAARLILRKQPGLAGRADKSFLAKRQSRIQGVLLAFFKRFRIFQP